MTISIAQHYFSFFETPDSPNKYQTTQRRLIRTTPPISIFDAKENTDAALMAISSAWARHSAAANGFGT